MMLESALVAELTKTGTTLYGLVGSRIYPLRLPQGATLPAIRYQRISTPRYHAMGGDSNLSSPRMQLDIFAETYGSAKAVSEALRKKLQNFSGTMGTTSVNVSNVAVLLLDQSENTEEDTKHTRIRMDFSIYHDEST